MVMLGVGATGGRMDGLQLGRRTEWSKYRAAALML